jgi:hypothetical protein
MKLPISAVSRPESGQSACTGRFRGVSRRSLLGTVGRAAAWTAPAIVTATAAPAAVASPIQTLTARTGMFAQVFDTSAAQRYATQIGISSFIGGSATAAGDAQWSDATGSTAKTGLVANGTGVFTPGGSIAKPAAPYGGVGLWISAPVTDTGAFAAGTTTLPARAVFDMTFTVTFPPGVYSYSPSTQWNAGAGPTMVRITDGTNPLRTALNGVAFSTQFLPEVMTDDTWSGTVRMTTLEDLVVAGPTERYAQILFSQVATWYTERELSRFQVAVQVISGALTVQSAGGGSPTSLPLAGQMVTSFITDPKPLVV